jgi:site-specific DNA-methyltransferase (adenine-specific)
MTNNTKAGRQRSTRSLRSADAIGVGHTLLDSVSHITAIPAGYDVDRTGDAPALQVDTAQCREAAVYDRLAAAAAIIRAKLAAVANVDGTAVDRDIEARRLESAVGLIWAEIKGLLAKSLIKPGPWCKAELDVSNTSMDRRLRLHKHWDDYVNARRNAGASGYSGLAYAMLLIKVSLRETKKHGLPFRSRSDTDPRLPHEHGSQPHHDRLKIAASELLAARDYANRLAQELAKHAPQSPVLVDKHGEIKEPISLTAAATVLSPEIRKISIGDCDLFHGDCFKVMAGLKPGTIDLLVGDLPYGMTNVPWDVPLNIILFFRHALRLLRPRGVILMCAAEPFSSELIHTCRPLFRDKWHWWDDGQVGNFLHTGHHPLKIGEDLIMFSPAGRGFTFNPQKVPLAKPRVQWTPQISSSVHRQPLFVKLPHEPTQYESSHPTNLVFFPTTREDRLMPTQKPLAMLRYFIETYSNTGDLVADFTLGTGTTAVAALQSGRRFVGAELNAEHFKGAVERVRRTAASSTVATELAAN